MQMLRERLNVHRHLRGVKSHDLDGSRHADGFRKPLVVDLLVFVFVDSGHSAAPFSIRFQLHRSFPIARPAALVGAFHHNETAIQVARLDFYHLGSGYPIIEQAGTGNGVIVPVLAGFLGVQVKAKNMNLSFWRKNKTSLEDYMETLVFETPESEHLFETVMGLPEKYRIVIHLFYYEDYSVREIGEILKISESNVKVRLSRGRMLLRETLKEEWDDDK